VRARNAADLSQKDVAEALHVSQPYIAAVERGAKPMSLSLMVRYANAVGASVEIKQGPRSG
jgi:transcriptional regulator with XRE-family HTH domain